MYISHPKKNYYLIFLYQIKSIFFGGFLLFLPSITEFIYRFFSKKNLHFSDYNYEKSRISYEGEKVITFLKN